MHKISVEFLAAGGNVYPSSADIDLASGLIAYGAGQNIALWRPCRDLQSSTATGGVQALLAGHSALVTAVKLMDSRDPKAPIIISGAADGSIRVWMCGRDSESSSAYTCCAIAEGHARSINAIAVLATAKLFVSAAADASFKVWRCTAPTNAGAIMEDIEHLQTVSTKPALIPLTLSIAQLTASEGVVLAVAGTSAKVQIYKSESAGTDFSLAASLSGHEGWIRSLDFVEDTVIGGRPSLLLASASQDKYIRLWRIRENENVSCDSSTFDAVTTMIGGAMSNKAHRFEAHGVGYSVNFEALLVGHEDWVFNARWLKEDRSLRLLSASADNSLSIWEPEDSSGVWTSVVRLGEISAQKGATTATGSTGGFWLGLWCDGGKSVLSLGKTGGWRTWRRPDESDDWIPNAAVSGHTGPVNGISWSRDGAYLISTSEDKTTRLFAPMLEDGSWHEFSRPQIHGYDLNCIDTIGNTRFISGADEKLLRVFDMPRAVSQQLSNACGIERAVNGSAIEAANMPVLGLSNKAIEAGNEDAGATEESSEEKYTNDPGEEMGRSVNTTTMPTEDQLSRSLLWPEVEKLYGHGYEICAVAVSNDGALVATTCKASTTTHAAIRIYRTEDWRISQPPLEAHALTVTRLRFSPDDTFLLSVSRDRQCAVFEKIGDETYTLVAGMPQKAHSRMVLDATWLPSSEEGNAFATAGRDKSVHLWRLKSTGSPRLTKTMSIDASAPVTAIDCLSTTVDGKSVIAYGLEDGSVFVALVNLDSLTLHDRPQQLNQDASPSKSVTQLCWRPATRQSTPRPMLAIASEDCSIRILAIQSQPK